MQTRSKANPGPQKWVSTNIGTLDTWLGGGLQLGQAYSLHGDTNSGKSRFCIDIATKTFGLVAENRGKNRNRSCTLILNAKDYEPFFSWYHRHNKNVRDAVDILEYPVGLIHSHLQNSIERSCKECEWYDEEGNLWGYNPDDVTTTGIRMNDGKFEHGEDDHPYCGSMWNDLDDLTFWMNEEAEVGWNFYKHIGLIVMEGIDFMQLSFNQYCSIKNELKRLASNTNTLVLITERIPHDTTKPNFDITDRLTIQKN